MRKRRKSNLIKPAFLWRTKVSEALCKRDWHNMRLYLFCNEQKFGLNYAGYLLVDYRQSGY